MTTERTSLLTDDSGQDDYTPEPIEQEAPQEPEESQETPFPETTPSSEKTGVPPAKPAIEPVSEGAQRQEQSRLQQERQSSHQLQQSQRRVAELEWHQIQAERNTAIDSQRRKLESLGLLPNEVEENVQSYTQLQDEIVKTKQMQKDMETHYQGQEVERRAKDYTANEFSQKYGIPKEKLMASKSPDAMELLAVKWQGQQGKINAQQPKTFDDNRPAARGIPNRAKRLQQLNAKPNWTDKEIEEVGRLREQIE